MKAIGAFILLFSFLSFREITLAWTVFTLVGIACLSLEVFIESR